MEEELFVVEAKVQVEGARSLWLTGYGDETAWYTNDPFWRGVMDAKQVAWWIEIIAKWEQYIEQRYNLSHTPTRFIIHRWKGFES